MTVIAITREVGTRGLDVAEGLAKRLNLDVVNDELIERDIASLAGVSGEVVHRYFAGSATLLERWRTNSKRLSEGTSEGIYQLAAKGNVVLRGWGATYLLRDIPHVMCVRICAPISVRQEVLVERGLAPNAMEARDLIERQTSANDRVIRRLFGTDGKDASIYAVVLNTARLSVEMCIEQLALLASSAAFQETPKSSQALMDRLIHVRVQTAFDKRFATDVRFSRIVVDVVDGRVTLTGETVSDYANDTAVRFVQDVEGVAGVRSEIAVGSFPRRRA
jgi:cytidylate kinase